MRAYWNGTLKSMPDVSLDIGASAGRVLISPVGNRPGVLFSAMEACRRGGAEPALCIVICSRESESFIPQALAAAGYDGDVKTLRVEDPFGGGNEEIQRLANESQAASAER